MKPIIKIENLSKLYRLGTIGTGTLSRDLNRWWARARGREDPYQRIGEVNDRATKSKSEFVWALKDINLEVIPGEVLGIIGKNGAGKSTLLKILSKVTGPTTGRIMYNGRIGSLLEVGTGFHSELTGRENIYLNGAILGMTRAEVRSKLDEIIDFSGCERYIDTPVKRYSSGMTVRLGFAVAAHLEPEILVVDEVLAVGDAEFQKKAVGKMQDITEKQGRTVLFVSHNMASIKNLCQNTILLDKGTIKYKGISDIVISNYFQGYLKGNEGFYAHEKRQGVKEFQIKNIQLKGEDEKLTNIIRLGDRIKILISYECAMSHIGKSIDAYISIYNSLDEPLIRLETNYSNTQIKLEQTSGTIVCELEDKFLLKSGNYYLSYAIRYKGLVLDRRLKSYFFEVVDDDYFCTGKSVSDNPEAKIALKHNWKII